jgi:hypothetical protein
MADDKSKTDGRDRFRVAVPRTMRSSILQRRPVRARAGAHADRGLRQRPGKTDEGREGSSVAKTRNRLMRQSNSPVACPIARVPASSARTILGWLGPTNAAAARTIPVLSATSPNRRRCRKISFGISRRTPCRRALGFWQEVKKPQ